MKLLKGKKGFTLIELVVVIAILGILAGIAIPRFLNATESARGARILADLRTIDSAIVIYNAKTGSFPADGDGTELLTDAPTATPPTYALLAAWPAPPQGTCRITVNAGGEYHWDNATATYAIGADKSNTEHRALLNGESASDLLGKTAN